MSKTAKQIMAILIALIIGCVVFVYIALSDKQKAEKAQMAMTKELDAYQTREAQYLKENKSLKDQVKIAQDEKAKIQKELDGVDEKISALNAQIETVTGERDEWQGRVDKLQKEREGLLAKLDKKQEPKIIYKYIEPDPKKEEKIPDEKAVSFEGLDDSYWAKVLKEKAALEVKLANLNKELSDTIVAFEELRKENTDYQLDIEKLRSEKESIMREIKSGKDLADTLSLELARTKSDKKFLKEQIEKINNNNENLRSQIKQLTSNKIALEKSIIRLTGEKNNVEKKLMETEGVIQNKIEEIWSIKESLTKDRKPNPAGVIKEIELPPIIVSADDPAAPKKASPDEGKRTDPVSYSPGLNGNVVSINDENNFVILDIGEKDGIGIGDKLAIYRDTDYIAEVEVIQIRSDISAADIRSKSSNIQIGDIVR